MVSPNIKRITVSVQVVNQRDNLLWMKMEIHRTRCFSKKAEIIRRNNYIFGVTVISLIAFCKVAKPKHWLGRGAKVQLNTKLLPMLT